MDALSLFLLVVWGVSSLGSFLFYERVARVMQKRRKALQENRGAQRVGKDYVVWARVGMGISAIFFASTLVALFYPGSPLANVTGITAISLPPVIQLFHSGYLLRRVLNLEPPVLHVGSY